VCIGLFVYCVGGVCDGRQSGMKKGLSYAL